MGSFGVWNKIKKGFKKWAAKVKEGFEGFNKKVIQPILKPINNALQPLRRPIRALANTIAPGTGGRVVDVVSDSLDAVTSGDWGKIGKHLQFKK